VSFPEGYRDWHHVKSLVIEEGHPLHGAFGGMHHIYTNAKALEGYRSETFPDGGWGFEGFGGGDLTNSVVGNNAARADIKRFLHLYSRY
jgi:hypothetical protein